jgi:hypothetical protein
MQVSYKIVGVGGWTVLLDESAGTGSVKWQPRSTMKVQETPLASSQVQFRNPLGNVSVSHQWSWNQVYATNDAAAADMQAKQAIFQGPGVKFHVMTVNGATVNYYANCVLADYNPSLSGVGVDHEMSFKSDGVSAIAPST